MNDRKQQLEAIFHAAAEMSSPEQRESYLNDACGGDASLRGEVQTLLRAVERADRFFGDPGLGEMPVASTAPLDRASPPINPNEAPGTLIGRYKLREKIGEGGCGVVFVAEQEEPVRRRVALKVIKSGMDTKSVVARFEAERQALAMMDHPNIAKVLDAGATETGRPYFVMELVRGVKITDYCDQNNLSTTARLDLFIKICHAVQHAHQKGIVHRDLKPSNILVTLHDGEPVPKVIDFGIAKAIEGRLTHHTVYTELRQFLGTPAYMCPEQAEMSGLDIDTRTDVYSLGVLLYELLTGKTPFDPQELLEASLDEVRRRIREEEPLCPSTRLSTMLHADLATVAKHQAVEPPGLIHLLRGDLDWIVMKCLEKDRRRRYDTPSELAADLKHHLAHEPVSAAAPSLGYQLSKLYRKHRRVFAGAGAVAAALLLGLIVAWWQAACAIVNERNATLETAKRERVASFLKDVLNGLSPMAGHSRIGTALVERLDETAQRIEQDFQDQPDVEAELCTTLGLVYGDLELPSKAEQMHRKALALRRTLPPAQRNSPGLATSKRERPPVRSTFFGDEDPTLAASLYNVGTTLQAQNGRDAEARAMFEEALSLNRKLLGPDSPKVANCLNHLALVALFAGREAESMLREALAIQKKHYGAEHWEMAWTFQNMSSVLERKGALREAAATRRQAVALDRKFYGEKHFDGALFRAMLADVLIRLGTKDDLVEAEELLRTALPTWEMVAGPHHYGTRNLRTRLASILRQHGKVAEADALPDDQSADSETK
jgi:eukaryotic-like serine/threonine-protein kinase